MDKNQILVIGRDPETLKKLSGVVNENPKWESTAAVDDETAIELFHQRSFEVVVLLSDITGASEKKFRSLFSFGSPQFLTGVADANVLLAGIGHALDQRKRPLNMVDDPFHQKK